MTTHTPTTEAHVADIVQAALSEHRRLAITGGGSKAGIGRATPDADTLDISGLTGVVDYAPAELVLTVRPGMPLSEILALVESQGQMLAFEPYDPAPLFGRDAGSATIGGVVAAGLSGSGRVSAGAVRDHLLGFTAISGRGERFVAGAKVVKNVTGYDLPKLFAGSWGRLGALTEITLKVLPRPRESVTRLIHGQDVATACRAMGAALGSQAAVAAAAYLPENGGTTALRLDGVGPSIQARLAILDALPGCAGEAGEGPWETLKTLPQLAGDRPLWRVSLPSGQCATFCAALGEDADYAVDWGGALVWLASDCNPRAQAEALGGHAMLIRAGAMMTEDTPTFHPQPAPLAALEDRVRRAFDPQDVFATGRFG